jgi:hypothetical protein
MEINKDELRSWIAALRSGNYRQTTGALEDNYGFCCLGVACKVLIPADKLTYKEGTLRTKLISGGVPEGQNNAPLWLKLINEDFEKRHGKCLITLNDTDKESFETIANLLEKYYLSDGN